MNIWFDITHVPPLNFFKALIIKLAKESHTVYVTVLDRGKLPKIVQNELGNRQNIIVTVIGQHRMNKWSVLWDANILRLGQLFLWSKGKKINVSISTGLLNCIISRFKGIKSYTFIDDPQAVTYKAISLFSTKNHCCLYKIPTNYHLSKRDVILPTLKEWAYLAPSVFTPNISVLTDYAIMPHRYLFVREVSVGTSNYASQEADSVLQIAKLIPSDMPVLLSLEKKDKYKEYPQNWILLQEPLQDVHSLIYYSAGLISSGDSMAREASLLGVPSYYLGIRYSMPANAVAADVGSLDNQQTMSIEKWIEKTLSSQEKKPLLQEEVRASINGKFVDINQYMYDLVTQANKK